MVEKNNKSPKKRKCPTPIKRIKQNKKHNLHNRSFKSRVKTAVQNFKAALYSKDMERAHSLLRVIYSLMDKGVKNGVYKKNKGARTKAQMALLHKSA